MVYWSDIYKEIGQKIMDNIAEVKHIDLWHEQVNYLTEELPFTTPAVFLEFNVLKAEDSGKLVQVLDTQIDMHVFHETFSDTYMNAVMQEDALEYMNIITKLNALFHGKPGVLFSAPRKTDMQREESGGSGNLYRLTFECQVHDYSAEKLYNETETATKELNIQAGDRPVVEPSNDYDVVTT